VIASEIEQVHSAFESSFKITAQLIQMLEQYTEGIESNVIVFVNTLD